MWVRFCGMRDPHARPITVRVSGHCGYCGQSSRYTDKTYTTVYMYSNTQNGGKRFKFDGPHVHIVHKSPRHHATQKRKKPGTKRKCGYCGPCANRLSTLSTLSTLSHPGQLSTLSTPLAGGWPLAVDCPHDPQNPCEGEGVGPAQRACQKRRIRKNFFFYLQKL